MNVVTYTHEMLTHEILTNTGSHLCDRTRWKLLTGLNCYAGH